jgi:hypothetical protein
MREVLTGRDKQFPAPMPMFRAMGELPWMRRERIDGNLRRSMYELESLIEEHDGFEEQYQGMIDGLQACVSLIDTIEDIVDDRLRGKTIEIVPESRRV